MSVWPPQQAKSVQCQVLAGPEHGLLTWLSQLPEPRAGSRGASRVIAISVLDQHSMPNKATGCGHERAHAPSSKPENPPLRLPGADGIPPGPVVLDEREAPPSPLTFPFPVSNGPAQVCYHTKLYKVRCAHRAHKHYQVTMTASPYGAG